jgi:hypothetical protein
MKTCDSHVFKMCLFIYVFHNYSPVITLLVLHVTKVLNHILTCVSILFQSRKLDNEITIREQQFCPFILNIASVFSLYRILVSIYLSRSN